MDTLFLGVPHAIPCCVLWLFGGEFKRTQGGKTKRKAVYPVFLSGSENGHRPVYDSYKIIRKKVSRF
jgi:hypothetical protein